MEANFEDMCEITNLTEEAVFENLQGRFKDDQIFTYIGPTLLIVNPYRIIPKLFDEDTLQRITEETLRGNYKGPPHIYAVASKAFRGMKNRDDKQSIIISGESGAGKTESTKYCMQILTKLSKRQTHAIEHKILACNPVLEAFGNSKTVRNENSSRFGKYVQILFGRDHTIKGAKIQSYLLEKSRVSMVEQGERNFHVFYALAAVGKCGTRAAENYLYLNRGQCLAANNINDRDFFKQIEESFT
jgi:myosin-7